MEIIEGFVKYGVPGILIMAFAIMAYSTLHEFGRDLHGFIKRHPWPILLVGSAVLTVSAVIWAYLTSMHAMHPDDRVALVMHVKLALTAAMFSSVMMAFTLLVLLMAVMKVVFGLHRDLQNLRRSSNAALKKP